MQKDTILVISNKYDYHTDGIINSLNKTGYKIIRLNTEDFLQNKIIINSNSAFNIQITTPEGRTINPQSVKSVYVRRISPINTENIDKSFQKFVNDEAKTVLNGLFHILLNSKWMDCPLVRQKTSNKIYQLHLALSCGLVIPKTIITNDSATIKKFCANQKIIYKTLFRPIIELEKGTSIIHTTLLTNKLTEKLIKNANIVPCILQEYINKKYELRIHIIGEKIISVKIDSQKLPNAKIDWRVADFNKLTYSEYILPTCS